MNKAEPIEASEKAMRALKKLIASLFLALLSTSAFAVTNAQLFAWATATYPSHFPGTPTAGLYQQYTFQRYSNGNYLAVDNTGTVSVYGPVSGNAILSVGSLTSFAPTITAWEATPAGTTKYTGSGIITAAAYPAYEACFNNDYVTSVSLSDLAMIAYSIDIPCKNYAQATAAGLTSAAASQIAAKIKSAFIPCLHNTTTGKAKYDAGAYCAGYSASLAAGKSASQAAADGAAIRSTFNACKNEDTYCLAYAEAIFAGSSPAAASAAAASFTTETNLAERAASEAKSAAYAAAHPTVGTTCQTNSALCTPITGYQPSTSGSSSTGNGPVYQLCSRTGNSSPPDRECIAVACTPSEHSFGQYATYAQCQSAGGL